jgi:ubiquinone/menaquinone biosynthesis C-methylase UbiE
LGLCFFWRDRLEIFLSEFDKNDIILDLGSGTRRFSPHTLNVDIIESKEVDIVSGVTKLPFRSESVDGIMSEMLLEHLEDPRAFVSEMYRVLKPGGRTYASTVFLYPYHDAPRDYTRWTKTGLEALFKDFKKSEVGIYYGPMAAITTIVQSFLASLLSFGSEKLKTLWFLFFWIVLWPLRFADVVVSYIPGMVDEAAGFYIIAQK